MQAQTPAAGSAESPKPIWVNSSADNSVPGALISEIGLWDRNCSICITAVIKDSHSAEKTPFVGLPFRK